MTSSPDGVPPGRYRVPHPPPVGVHNPARPRSHMRPLIVVNAGAVRTQVTPSEARDLSSARHQACMTSRTVQPSARRANGPTNPQVRDGVHPCGFNRGLNVPPTHPPGRHCTTDSCTARLSIYNPADHCHSTPLPNTHGRQNQGRRDHQAGNHSTRSAAAPFSLETRGRGALGGT